MGNLTHTVSGDIASFRSAARVPIESLKCHFLPIQEGTGDPSPENVRPITGWSSITAYKAKKNIGHLVSYSAGTLDSPHGNAYTNGYYGQTLSTTDTSQPLTITSTQWPDENNKPSYKNGYFCIQCDNLQFGQIYSISFKVTNIINNPLECAISDIRIANPKGNRYTPTLINDNILLFTCMFQQNPNRPQEADIAIYNCGMSCTFSEFMITPQGMNDGIWEPYCGDIIPVTFPVLGKNKLPLTSTTTITSVGTGYNNTLSRTLTPGTIYQNVSVNNYWLGQSNSNYTNNVNNGEITYMCNEGAYGQGLCMEVLPSTQYIASIAENEKAEIRWSYFDAEGNCIGYDTTKKNKVITTPIQAKYALIVFTISSNNYKNQLITVTNAQVELGSVATTYEPYSSNNTVYGGYVDLITGDIVAEWVNLHLTSSLNYWAMGDRQNYNGKYFYYETSKEEERCLWPAGNLYDAAAASGEKYTHGTISNPWGAPGIYAQAYKMNDTKTCIRVGFLDNEIDSVQKFKDWLDEQENVYICYPLQSSRIIAKLSPTQLQTFIDQNNIWTNANSNTEVSYAIHDSALIQAAKKQIIVNEPHIETTSNAVATFNTDMTAPLKECKIYFNPVQATGTPSPTNIKSITGYTQLITYIWSNNLFNLNTDKITAKYINYKTGSQVTWGSSWNVSDFILIKSNTIYTLACRNYGLSDAGIAFYNANKEYISGIYNNSNNLEIQTYTFTTPQEAMYIRFTFIEPTRYPVIFAEGSAIPNFNNYNLNWNDEGILYGGYIDLITGNIYQTWIKNNISNMQWNNYAGKIYYYANIRPDYNTIYDREGTSIIYSDTLTPIGGAGWNTVQENQVAYINNGQYNNNIWIKLPEAMEHQDANTWIQTTYPDATICYKLKDPIYISTLSVPKIKTSIGQNSIQASTNGPVEIQYWTH